MSIIFNYFYTILKNDIKIENTKLVLFKSFQFLLIPSIPANMSSQLLNSNTVCVLLETASPSDVFELLKSSPNSSVELRYLIALSMRPEVFVTLGKSLLHGYLHISKDQLTEIIAITKTLKLPGQNRLFAAYAEAIGPDRFEFKGMARLINLKCTFTDIIDDAIEFDTNLNRYSSASSAPLALAIEAPKPNRTITKFKNCIDIIKLPETKAQYQLILKAVESNDVSGLTSVTITFHHVAAAFILKNTLVIDYVLQCYCNQVLSPTEQYELVDTVYDTLNTEGFNGPLIRHILKLILGHLNYRQTMLVNGFYKHLRSINSWIPMNFDTSVYKVVFDALKIPGNAEMSRNLVEVVEWLIENVPVTVDVVCHALQTNLMLVDDKQRLCNKLIIACPYDSTTVIGSVGAMCVYLATVKNYIDSIELLIVNHYPVPLAALHNAVVVGNMKTINTLYKVTKFSNKRMGYVKAYSWTIVLTAAIKKNYVGLVTKFIKYFDGDKLELLKLATTVPMVRAIIA